MADRQGLTLEKCRRRDARALDYGTFRLVRDTFEDGRWLDRDVVASDSQSRRGYGLTADQVESLLSSGCLTE
jgi:hypothetical protein